MLRFLIFLLLPIALSAQQLVSLDIEASLIEVDRLQQCYVVHSNQRVDKYNASGKLLASFNENNLGPITHIDLSNPFQPLLYYGDYQEVILLDRTLNEISRFNLNDLDFVQIEAIGMSSDNGLWIYDPNNFQLKKIGINQELQFESQDLSAILQDAFLPTQLIERDYRIYLNDPNYGILIFDNFGNFIKQLTILDVEKIQWVDDALQWLNPEKQLIKFQLRSFIQEKQPLSELGIESNELIQLFQVNNYFFLHYPKQVKIIAID